MSKKEGKALKSLKSSGRRGESVQENRTYVERLVRRIVEHVSYREAVRSEPKIIECLELYQQDLWDDEHCKREASQAEKKVAGASTSARASGTKKSGVGRRTPRGEGLRPARGRRPPTRTAGRTGHRQEGRQALWRVQLWRADEAGQNPAGVRDDGKKPKAKKKEEAAGHDRLADFGRRLSRPDGQRRVLREEDLGKARRLSRPTAAGRTTGRQGITATMQTAIRSSRPTPSPTQKSSLLRAAGQTSSCRVLYLACQQNETIKFEKKVRKERERTSQMPVLASSVHIQLLCSRRTERKVKSEALGTLTLRPPGRSS